MYVTDPFWSKYQLLINEREKVGIKELKNSKAFIDCSQKVDDVYKSLEDCNLIKKRKVLIVFDYMIAHVEANKKLSSIVIGLFLRARKVSISLIFISQSYFKVPKTVRVNATH